MKPSLLNLPASGSSPRYRILFYSHDSFGLGHFRRSLTIASYLVRHIEGLSVLMLTGLDSPASFESPPGIDFVKLPAVWKTGPDAYRSRHLRVSFQRVLRLRENMIRTIARAFDPALFVVDNVPRGVDGDVVATLRYLRKQRPHTRTVLTLRDVLDVPEHIVPQWRGSGTYDVLRRFYQEIWVAGCEQVFDPVALYALPRPVAAKVKYCGYVVRSNPPAAEADLRRELRIGEAPLVVVSCGGGGDGYELIRAYAAGSRTLADAGVYSAIFLGPDLPSAQRRELKQQFFAMGERYLVYDFRPDLNVFLRLASASVSMAGYNTSCEVIQSGCPAVLVPRVYPRREQWLRTEAFARHGVVRMLPADQLTPAALIRIVADLLAGGRTPTALPAGVDFAGTSRILRRVRRHLRGLNAELSTVETTHE